MSVKKSSPEKTTRPALSLAKPHGKLHKIERALEIPYKDVTRAIGRLRRSRGERSTANLKEPEGRDGDTSDSADSSTPSSSGRPPPSRPARRSTRKGSFDNDQPSSSSNSSSSNPSSKSSNSNSDNHSRSRSSPSTVGEDDQGAQDENTSSHNPRHSPRSSSRKSQKDTSSEESTQSDSESKSNGDGNGRGGSGSGRPSRSGGNNSEDSSQDSDSQGKKSGDKNSSSEDSDEEKGEVKGDEERDGDTANGSDDDNHTKEEGTGNSDNDKDSVTGNSEASDDGAGNKAEDDANSGDDGNKNSTGDGNADNSADNASDGGANTGDSDQGGGDNDTSTGNQGGSGGGSGGFGSGSGGAGGGWGGNLFGAGGNKMFGGGNYSGSGGGGGGGGGGSSWFGGGGSGSGNSNYGNSGGGSYGDDGDYQDGYDGDGDQDYGDDGDNYDQGYDDDYGGGGAYPQPDSARHRGLFTRKKKDRTPPRDQELDEGSDIVEERSDGEGHDRHSQAESEGLEAGHAPFEPTTDHAGHVKKDDGVHDNSMTEPSGNSSSESSHQKLTRLRKLEREQKSHLQNLKRKHHPDHHLITTARAALAKTREEIKRLESELEKSSNAASDKVENLEAIIADPKSTASERKKAHEDLAMARREKEEAHHDHHRSALSGVHSAREELAEAESELRKRKSDMEKVPIPPHAKEEVERAEKRVRKAKSKLAEAERKQQDLAVGISPTHRQESAKASHAHAQKLESHRQAELDELEAERAKYLAEGRSPPTHLAHRMKSAQEALSEAQNHSIAMEHEHKAAIAGAQGHEHTKNLHHLNEELSKARKSGDKDRIQRAEVALKEARGSQVAGYQALTQVTEAAEEEHRKSRRHHEAAAHSVHELELQRSAVEKDTKLSHSERDKSLKILDDKLEKAREAQRVAHHKVVQTGHKRRSARNSQHESSMHIVHAHEVSVAAAEEELRHQEAIVDAAGSRVSPEQLQSLKKAQQAVISAKEEHKVASRHEQTLRSKTDSHHRADSSLSQTQHAKFLTSGRQREVDELEDQLKNAETSGQNTHVLRHHLKTAQEALTKAREHQKAQDHHHASNMTHLKGEHLGAEKSSLEEKLLHAEKSGDARKIQKAREALREAQGRHSAHHQAVSDHHETTTDAHHEKSTSNAEVDTHHNGTHAPDDPHTSHHGSASHSSISQSTEATHQQLKVLAKAGRALRRSDTPENREAVKQAEEKLLAEKNREHQAGEDLSTKHQKAKKAAEEAKSDPSIAGLHKRPQAEAALRHAHESHHAFVHQKLQTHHSRVAAAQLEVRKRQAQLDRHHSPAAEKSLQKAQAHLEQEESERKETSQSEKDLRVGTSQGHQRAVSQESVSYAKKLQGEAKHREDKLKTAISRARSERQDTSHLETRLDRAHHDYATATTHLLHVEGHHQSLEDGEEGDRLRNDVHTRQNELDSARDRHHREDSTESNDHLTQSEAKLKEAEQHQDAHHQKLHEKHKQSKEHLKKVENSHGDSAHDLTRAQHAERSARKSEHRSSVDAKSSKLGQVKIEEAEVHRHQEKHADSQHEQESEKHKIAAQHLHHAQEEHAEAERKEEKQRKKIADEHHKKEMQLRKERHDKKLAIDHEAREKRSEAQKKARREHERAEVKKKHKYESERSKSMREKRKKVASRKHSSHGHGHH